VSDPVSSDPLVAKSGIEPSMEIVPDRSDPVRLSSSAENGERPGGVKSKLWKTPGLASYICGFP
jgi:hypothetical protein